MFARKGLLYDAEQMYNDLIRGEGSVFSIRYIQIGTVLGTDLLSESVSLITVDYVNVSEVNIAYKTGTFCKDKDHLCLKIQQVAAEHFVFKRPETHSTLHNSVTWTYFSLYYGGVLRLTSIGFMLLHTYSHPKASCAKKMGHTLKTALNSCFCVSFHGCPTPLIIQGN